MKLYDLNKEDCCGCNACVQICPKNAISFKYDEQGFGYPVVNEEQCINCGLCDRVCNFKKIENVNVQQKYYAAKNVCSEERSRSRSGGIFFLFAKKIISLEGIVYGVVLDDAMNVTFTRATTIEECKRMQGSKYVESKIEGIYSNVKQDLKAGKNVLFAGTACQVAGLYGYLGAENYEKLFTIDIVCHGVMSQKIFRDYVEFMEKKFKGKIKKWNFRDKTLGWDTHVESFIINEKKYFTRYYSRIFYSNNALRPSCSNCPFASYNRPGDISVADFWGLQKVIPNFDDNKGVSAIIVNSLRGETLLKELNDKMKIVPVEKEVCKQPNLCHPTPKAKDADVFWNIYIKQGIKGALLFCGGYDLGRRIKWKWIDLPKMKREMDSKK